MENITIVYRLQQYSRIQYFFDADMHLYIDL